MVLGGFNSPLYFKGQLRPYKQEKKNEVNAWNYIPISNNSIYYKWL